MFEIWVEWADGASECVDSADTKSDASHLINEYRMAYGTSAKRIWVETL